LGKKYAFFLGCLIPNRYPGIEAAARKVLPRIGIELVDMNGASCCPAPGVVKSFSRPAWLAMAARNLCIAEEMGLEVLTFCNGCYGTLAEANHSLKADRALRDSVNSKLKEIGKAFKGSIGVRHLAEVLMKEVTADGIKKAVTKPLNLKAAVHYGCHLIKPKVLREWVGSAERPTFLDELTEALGAESVEWEDKMACCGAGGGVRSAILDVSLRMLNRKLLSAKEAGADFILNVCPFCHLQFDRGQIEFQKLYGLQPYDIPVLHYVQALGLAMGYSPHELGVDMNFVRADRILEKLS
jgi:heterodisulfide reductase subunit B